MISFRNCGFTSTESVQYNFLNLNRTASVDIGYRESCVPGAFKSLVVFRQVWLDKRRTIWTSQEEVCRIKMVEEKGEINT